MSNLPLLSLQQVVASVQPDEDFAPPPLLFFQADGVTPISLAGINFTAKIGSLATLTSAAGGGITVSGNALTLNIPAAQKNWATGRYPFTLLGSDGTTAQDLFASSFITVGQAASFSIVPFRGGGSVNVLTGFTAPAFLASFMNLSPTQQAIIAQAIIAVLPVQTGPNAPVNAGQGFINSSNFVVIAQS